MKIFYSWQSDLPNKDNRSFIQGCIDKVQKKYKSTIAIEADRDTKNRTGSPDITTTIFEKIDDCDLFIADISIVNKPKYKLFRGKARPTPNPNVLLELGYAASTLGWDRVICVYNSDYSEMDALPFDLRQHRITSYSLHGKKREEVQKSVIDAFSATIKGLIDSGSAIRPKGTHSLHCLMGYDCISRKMAANVITFEIGFIDLRKDLVGAATALVEKLNQSTIRFTGEGGIRFNGVHINLDAASIIRIEESEKSEITGAVNTLLGIELSPVAFRFGDLKERQNYLQGGYIYDGSTTEEEKYRDYLQLKRYLSEITILDLFCKPFQNILALPLVIKNVSKYVDRNIKIKITVEGDDFEIIAPTQKLIDSELGNNIGFVCNYGFVPELFMVSEATGVNFDEGVECRDCFDDNPYINLWDAGTSCDADDYLETLGDYIATPSVGGVVEFKINSLQANEAKWLDKLILIKVNHGGFKLSYSITSDNTDGNVSGALEYTGCS